MILVDTSALFALADRDDAAHAHAKRILARLESEGEEMIVHTYVLVEAFALLHRRLGVDLALRMSEETASLPMVVVDRGLHDRGIAWLRDARSPRLSLVDAVSFVLMSERDLSAAFAFDVDFERAGFKLCRP